MIKFSALVFTVFFALSAYGREGIVKAVQDAFELYSVGSFDEAAPLFEEAAQMMKENAPSDVKGRIKVSLYAGLSYREAGDYQAACLWLMEAFSLAASSGDKAYAVRILACIAETRRMQGDYAKSSEDYLTAINSGLTEEKEKAALYYGLAESCRLSGKYVEALDACGKSEEISKKFSMDKLYLSCVIVDGESYRMKGDYAKSMQMFGVALDTGRARNYQDIAVAALNGLALVSEVLGRTDAARDRFEEALSLSIKNEAFDGVVLISGKILSLLPEKGSFSEKGDEILETVKSLEPLKDSEMKIALLKLASGYYGASGMYDKMYIASEALYNEAVGSGSDADASGGLYGMAAALFGMEKYQAASDRLDEAVSRAASAEASSGMGKMYALKGECFVKMGYSEDAALIMEEAVRSAEDEKSKAVYGARLMEIKAMIGPVSGEDSAEKADALGYD